MKITVLGSGGFGYPLVFCNCEYCIQARKTGGKNIRTRSQSLINDDLLIDLPADTYSHFLTNGIEGHKINYLLVTHSHADHFYPDELEMRQGCYAHNMKHQVLEMYCGKGVKERFDYMNKKTENIPFSVLFFTMPVCPLALRFASKTQKKPSPQAQVRARGKSRPT